MSAIVVYILSWGWAHVHTAFTTYSFKCHCYHDDDLGLNTEDNETQDSCTWPPHAVTAV